MVLGKVALPIIVVASAIAETAHPDALMTILPLVLSGSLLGALGVLLTVRSRNRATDADADESHATAAGEWQTVYRRSIDDLNDKVTSLSRDLSRVRDQLRDTRVAQAKTETELAESRLAYRELDAAAGLERHDLRDQLAVLAVENVNLRTALDTANERIATLEARAGLIERRAGERRDDADGAARDRLAVLEDRADRSETRADAAGERADEAGRNAETQQHRNDDTPGHA